MAALGDKFKYDVFFSYAWAKEATGDEYLRDWSRTVADKIRTLLSQRFNAEWGPLHTYLDRDEAKSGQALNDELKKAAEGSAVFVAMVSEYYKADYCTKEANWACEKIASEGAAVADHVCILRVQHLSDRSWPAAFKEPNGNPLVYLDFCNKDGQPIDMSSFIMDGPLTDLAQPIYKAALEIGDKLKTIRTKIRAREEYQLSQLPPDAALLFFEAEVQDQARWSECSRILSEAKSIVLPTDPIPATAVIDPGNVYIGCDGLVLLRSRLGDNIGLRIKRAYLDRRGILRGAAAQKIPWALLDDLDEPPPECKPFQIPRVRLQGDWVPELQKALFGG